MGDRYDEIAEELVELASVRGYLRRAKGGKIVRVRDHQRADVAAELRKGGGADAIMARFEAREAALKPKGKDVSSIVARETARASKKSSKKQGKGARALKWLLEKDSTIETDVFGHDIDYPEQKKVDIPAQRKALEEQLRKEQKARWASTRRGGDKDQARVARERARAAEEEKEARRRLREQERQRALRLAAQEVYEDTHLAVVLASKGLLDRSPKSNWVEDAGGLPPYIEEVAHSLHTKRGMPISKAIAIAVGRVKAWARGDGNTDPDTKAKAAKAVAQWEALKGKNKAKAAAKDD